MDTDYSCGRFDNYCWFCAMYLGHEKKCEGVSVQLHNLIVSYILLNKNRATFKPYAMCSICVIRDTLKVSK